MCNQRINPWLFRYTGIAFTGFTLICILSYLVMGEYVKDSLSMPSLLGFGLSFFCYNVLVMFVHKWITCNYSSRLVGFYIINKIINTICAFSVLAIFLLCTSENKVAGISLFSCNYLFSIIVINLYFVRIESLKKED